MCDSIFNIGFCVNAVMGEFVFFFEEVFAVRGRGGGWCLYSGGVSFLF